MDSGIIYKHIISSLYKMLCWREEKKHWITIYDELLSELTFNTYLTSGTFNKLLAINSAPKYSVIEKSNPSPAKKHKATFSNLNRDLEEKAIFEKVKPNQLCLGICRGLSCGSR